MAEEPDNLPEVVERDAGPGEGRRWPYLTYVEVLGAVDQAAAPTPRDLDIAMSQGGHRRLEEDTYRRAALHVPGGFAPSPVDTALSRSVPIERATDEPIKQRFEPSTKLAYRREQQLVDRFAQYLQDRGHGVTRNALTLRDGTALYTDLFDHDTRLLVEAKAVSDRAAIRMAIGQLLDYRRLVDPAPEVCAVLLPEAPTEDLVDLLDSLDIVIVWESDGLFSDNRRGALS